MKDFFCIAVKANDDYRFSVWARLPEGGKESKLRVELVKPNSMRESHTLAYQEVIVNSREWKKYQVILKPTVTEAKSLLRIFLASPTGVDL